MATPPKDRHRMKRPQPKDAQPGRRREQNIKKAYSAEQLQEIGAIAITWNQLEWQVDFLLLIALDMPMGLWLPVAKRINGMDGKLQILRLRANQSEDLNDEGKDCVNQSLDAVAEYKTYRDAVVHSTPFNIEKGIAQQIGRRAETREILVTMNALTGLYERLIILQDELRDIDLLFRFVRAPETISPVKRDPSQSPEEQVLQALTAQVRRHQNRRQSLPPLPEFPSEEAQAAAAMGWFQQWPDPQRRVVRPEARFDPHSDFVPGPPPDDQKK
jgi:hypothetical protein